LSLINNILEVSELESGKYLLNITLISLTELAENVLRLLQVQTQTHQINLVLDLKVKREEDKFYADLERLTEILLNLLSNGIKFTPAGGTVTLRIWREARQVIFEVEDNGIGISQQQIPLLFEKFQQLEGLLQRTHGGVGLGLALTKQLVELHGGNIQVESELGKGSVFTVYLPDQSLEKFSEERVLALKESQVNQSKTIILIAQDEENATYLCQLITAAGYQVVWLIDIETVIEQIIVLAPSLLIIDRSFSTEVIQKLRESLREINIDHSVKLVLLSHTIPNGLAEGIDAHLFLTMSPNQLLEKINSLVE
jgi:two-component system sensor histidine kinase/response regulator